MVWGLSAGAGASASGSSSITTGAATSPACHVAMASTASMVARCMPLMGGFRRGSGGPSASMRSCIASRFWLFSDSGSAQTALTTFSCSKTLRRSASKAINARTTAPSRNCCAASRAARRAKHFIRDL